MIRNSGCPIPTAGRRHWVSAPVFPQVTDHVEVMLVCAGSSFALAVVSSRLAFPGLEGGEPTAVGHGVGGVADMLLLSPRSPPSAVTSVTQPATRNAMTPQRPRARAWPVSLPR